MHNGADLLIDVPSAIMNPNKASVPVLKMIGFDGPTAASNIGPSKMGDPLVPKYEASSHANENTTSGNVIDPKNGNGPQINEHSESTVSVMDLICFEDVTPVRDILPAPLIRGDVLSASSLKPIDARNGKVPMKADKSARRPLPALLKIPRPSGLKSTAARFTYQRAVRTGLTLSQQVIDCNIANPMNSKVVSDFGSLHYSGESE